MNTMVMSKWFNEIEIKYGLKAYQGATGYNLPPPLFVFLPGHLSRTTSPHVFFDRLTDALTNHGDVVKFDNIGVGLNENVKGHDYIAGYATSSFTDFIDQVLTQRFPGRKISIIARSAGAAIATRLACIKIEAVSRVVYHAPGFKIKSLAERAIRQYLCKTTRRDVFTPEEITNAILSGKTKIPVSVADETDDSLDMANKLVSCHIPSLMIYGDNDEIVPAHLSGKNEFKGQMIIVQGGQHELDTEHSMDQYFSKLVTFLVP